MLQIWLNLLPNPSQSLKRSLCPSKQKLKKVLKLRNKELAMKE
jgi:hypothetical protein